MGTRGELFSTRVMSEKRTYFFNVKENRKGDLFLNIVESQRHGEDGFERRSVIVYEEDMKAFVASFDKAVAFMKDKRS
ncbi:MAG: DUF3276 family protein [Spirochaetales bacterium]|nr:DUF3276 family protein [Spirochaetales bacterium]